MLDLDPKSTALILFDLQRWQLSMPIQPHSADTVLANALALAGAVKKAGGLLATVQVHYAPDFADMLKVPVDAGMVLPAGGITPQILELHPDIAALPADFAIRKKQWSAFYGTDLDLQLRRRGVKTLIIGGIATSFGVESTTRDAWQHNYAVVVAEDASSGPGEGMHDFSVTKILPRISRVRKSAEIVAALGAAS